METKQESKWISTEEMLRNVKNDAEHEHEYNLLLFGGGLTSTHWIHFDTEKQMFALFFLKRYLDIISANEASTFPVQLP